MDCIKSIALGSIAILIILILPIQEQEITCIFNPSSHFYQSQWFCSDVLVKTSHRNH